MGTEDGDLVFNWDRVSVRMVKNLGDGWWWWLLNSVNILSVIEMYSWIWLNQYILYHATFTTIKKKSKKWNTLSHRFKNLSCVCVSLSAIKYYNDCKMHKYTRGPHQKKHRTRQSLFSQKYRLVHPLGERLTIHTFLKLLWIIWPWRCLLYLRLQMIVAKNAVCLFITLLFFLDFNILKN